MSDAQAAQARELSAGKGASLVFVIALAATAFMAAPVIRAPSERIFGSGEILSREDPNRDALVVIEQFRTGRVPPPYLQPLTDLPGQTLARLIGPVAGYNLLVLITFPLAAGAAYLLSRYVLASHLGAMVAGLAYAFEPFHVMQAGGHPHIAQTQWLPLYLLALWRCLDRPDPSRGTLLLLAAAAAALADFYGGFIVAALSPVALLAYGIGSPHQPSAGRGRRMVATALLLTAAAMAALGAVRYFAPAVMTHPGSTAFARSELFSWSARWFSYLVPPVDHPIWGPAVKGFWSRRDIGLSLVEHQQVSLSLALVALSLVSLWHFVRGDRDTPSTRMAPVLAILATAALLCSLSPERTIGSFTFVRPSALLYEVAPMFRAYARFGGVVGLMTSMLAGAGVAVLWRSRGSGRVAVAALLGLAVVEYAPFPPWRSRDLLPTAAHRWIRAQSAPLRVLDCVEPVRVSDTLSASLLGHDVSMLGGPGLDDCGEPRFGEKLKALGYTHAIVRGDTRAGAWLAEDPARFAARGALALGVGFEDSWILAVSTDRPGAYLDGWLGFYPREYQETRTWRWMKQTGDLRLEVIRESSGQAIELELRSFPENRRVQWFINGERRGEIDVAPEWRPYELPLGPLAAGEATLTLTCREPAVRANDRLQNNDLRSLGLAVGTWRIGDAAR